MVRLYLFILLLVALSCSRSKYPEGVLDAEKMQAVYWDFVRADVYTKELLSQDSSLNLDSASVVFQKQLFSKHKITKEIFYKSYNFYISHQLLMRDMLDTMLMRQQQILQKQTDSIQKRTDSIQKQIDSIRKATVKDSIVLSKPD